MDCIIVFYFSLSPLFFFFFIFLLFFFILCFFFFVPPPPPHGSLYYSWIWLTSHSSSSFFNWLCAARTFVWAFVRAVSYALTLSTDEQRLSLLQQASRVVTCSHIPTTLNTFIASLVCSSSSVNVPTVSWLGTATESCNMFHMSNCLNFLFFVFDIKCYKNIFGDTLLPQLIKHFDSMKIKLKLINSKLVILWS